MRFNKTALLGAALALIYLPLAAHADLITVNKTNEWSTVKVFGTLCAGSKGKFTPPNDTLHAKDGEVRALCLAQSPCEAKIIMSTSEADVRECKGKEIGYAKVTLADMKIVEAHTDIAGYTLSGEGTSTLVIN